MFLLILSAKEKETNNQINHDEIFQFAPQNVAKVKNREKSLGNNGKLIVFTKICFLAIFE